MLEEPRSFNESKHVHNNALEVGKFNVLETTCWVKLVVHVKLTIVYWLVWGGSCHVKGWNGVVHGACGREICLVIMGLKSSRRFLLIN